LRNSTAVIFTLVGGAFYLVGGALVALLAGDLSSSLNGLSGFSGLSSFGLTSGSTTVDASGVSDVVYLVGAFGIISGALIIVGGVLLQSPYPNRRKAGGILAVVMAFIGALPALGGLFIGFVFTLIGGYLGLTYKAANPNLVVGLGPVGSLTLGPQRSAVAPGGSVTEAGRGPLNYCIKCGSRLRDGAVFCGACGARVPE
jgi:hypothetical protein